MTENKAMLTDLYQLTMYAAYLDNDKDDESTFDLFVRNLPKDWGYFVANGIEEAIDSIINLGFTDEDIDYLRQNGFKEQFLDTLKNFRFEGDLYAVKEGTIIFDNEPIIRVTASRTQAQLLESMLLNIVNYQTMIASKASRVINAAKKAKVVDFGLRRAQGEDAAMKGARACYMAGCAATSNVKAGKEYGIPISGTHAHSFVMSFKNEIDAFRAYVKTFPDNATLLIDTYDTLDGARNAAIVAKELEQHGHKLGAVRLDSGNLSDLSKKVREILNSQGLSYVRIVASNDLNEYKIEDLVKEGAPIDGYGVGTEMITAKPDAAISGVYKLVADSYGAKIKLSSHKKTKPGIKQIYRQLDHDGKFLNDIIALERESGVDGEPLLQPAIINGKRIREKASLEDTRNYCLDQVRKLPDYLRQTRVIQHYQVIDSPRLLALTDKLTQEYSHIPVSVNNTQLRGG